MECGKRVDEEVNLYLNTPVQPVEAMFDFLYADPPQDLLVQRAQAIAPSSAMDEIKNGAPGAQTNAADSAAIARGEESMTTTPITSSKPSPVPWRGSWNTTNRCWCWARTSASTAACSAPLPACSSASAPTASGHPLDETTIAGLTIGPPRRA